MTMNEYRFREFVIPEYMMDGIKAYVEDKRPVGDFLTAVICNDLSGAVWHADGTNSRNLPAFVAYFYNEAPASCWGSKEKMIAWLGLDDEQTQP